MLIKHMMWIINPPLQKFVKNMNIYCHKGDTISMIFSCTHTQFHYVIMILEKCIPNKKKILFTMFV
jgi:hypothetical protein